VKSARLLILWTLLQAFATGAEAACIVAAPRLSFGPYDPLSAAGSTTSGVIIVLCDFVPPPNVTVMIGPSANSGGFTPRRMLNAGGVDTLDYNLYVDPSSAIVWGDGRPGTGVRTNRVFRGKPWVLTVFGRMPPGQDVTPGNYIDNIAITVNF